MVQAHRVLLQHDEVVLEHDPRDHGPPMFAPGYPPNRSNDRSSTLRISGVDWNADGTVRGADPCQKKGVRAKQEARGAEAEVARRTLRGLSWQKGEVTFVMATKNKHSSNVSSNAQAPQQASAVDESIKLVDQASAAFGDPSPALSKADKRHVAKPFPGVEKVIPTIASLANQHGVVVSRFPIDAMTGSMQTAQTLAPLRAAVAAFLKKVDDAMLSANGTTWQAASFFYTTLSRVKGTDAQLEAALAPLEAYFSKPTKAKKKNAAAVAAPPAATQAPATPPEAAPGAPAPAHSDVAPAQAAGSAGTPHASS